MARVNLVGSVDRRVPVLYLDLDGTVRHGKTELGRFVNHASDVVVFPEVRRIWRVAAFGPLRGHCDWLSRHLRLRAGFATGLEKPSVIPLLYYCLFERRQVWHVALRPSSSIFAVATRQSRTLSKFELPLAEQITCAIGMSGLRSKSSARGRQQPAQGPERYRLRSTRRHRRDGGDDHE